MSIMPRTGVCFNCGHDWGNGIGSPETLRILSAGISETETLKARIAELEAALAQRAAGDGDERAKAELWRTFCRRLDRQATPTSAKWKLVEISQMYGDETEIVDVEKAVYNVLTQQKG